MSSTEHRDKLRSAAPDTNGATTDQLLKLISALGAEKRGMLAELLRPAAEPIAIVGMSCRFAEADSPGALWRVVHEGVDAITRVPKSRWDVDALLEQNPELAPTAWGGFIDGVEQFEPGVFGISPREAIQMDPQQRLILEGVWEALEDAGLPLERVAGTSAGVFVGACGGGEYASLCARDPRAVGSHTGTGVASNMLSGRVSYVFDLKGPSVVVDTACSSSLVAVHLACESLRRKECPVAIAGGVNLLLSPDVMRMMFGMQLLAADGRCKPFDSRADGIARGEGCGVVVLKRLSDALAEGDRVMAVLRGTAINSDGRSNGLTAPTGAAQRDVIERALRLGGVVPREVGYVEAHGTGTALGDPIEVDALKEVLGRGRADGERCVLGSIKANIGHTEGAAGIAGLIKVVLALSHGVIPPQINVRRLNPHLALEHTPFVVPREPLPWTATRKVACVSSFGWSGTNAHAVVEGAPEVAPGSLVTAPAEPAEGAPILLPLSARSPAALRALARRWSRFLAPGGSNAVDRDIAYSASVRRSHHRFRHAVVGATRRELEDGVRALAAEAPDNDSSAPATLAERVVFVFPGQGSQWHGMSRGLLSERAFRESLEACDAALEVFTGWSALEMLQAGAAQKRWKEVDVIQPLLFAMQVSLAALWRSWGIEPDAVVGHSLGEIAASHVAGALSLEDAARVIALRSRLVRTTSGKGRMALAEISTDEARALVAPFDGRLSVAASNGPHTVLLSGEPEAVESAVSSLQARDVFCRYVDVDYASHSAQMVPLSAQLGALLTGVRPRAAQIPIYSTVLAQPIRGERLDAEYWVTNLREPVLFHPTVERLVREGRELFLEVSPHPVLVPSLESTLAACGSKGVALPSTRRDREERRSMRESLAALYALGRSVDWTRQFPEGGRRVVPLPTYAWQRDAYWPAPAQRRRARGLEFDQRLLADEGLALPDDTHVFQAELSAGAFPYLADHRVGGAVIFPAAGYVELALEAARSVIAGPCAVEALRFEQMLELPADESRKVQLGCGSRAGQAVPFRIASFSPSGWKVHVHGVLRLRSEPAPERRVRLSELEERCPEPLSVADFYAGIELGGISLGPSFRRLDALFVGAEEALARVRSEESATGAGAGCVIDPTLLDACFQVVGGALSTAATGSFMPVAVRSLIVHARPAGALWIAARIVEGASGANPVGDVQLLGEDGQVFLEVRGLELQRVGAARDPIDDWILSVDWEPQALPSTSSARAGSWLVVGEDAIASALHRGFEARGDRCLVVRDDVELVRRALREAGSELQGVVFVAPLADISVMADWAVAGSAAALRTLHALLDVKLERPPRFWLLTRAAHPVGQAPVSPAHTALWGFARTLMHEHPELRCSCVDVETSSDDVSAVVDELRSDGAENQIALRGAERHVARLVRGRAPAPPKSAAEGRPFRLVGKELCAFTRPAPGASQVEIEVSSAALDGSSERARACAGRIVALGPGGCSALNVGDEVVALWSDTPATHVVVDANAVVQRPQDVPAEVAVAALPLVAAAEHALIELARVSANESLLLTDGASPEGRALAACAVRAGARVFVIGAELESCRLVPPGDGVAQALAATGGAPFDVVVSLAGQASWAAAVAPLGRWVVVGEARRGDADGAGVPAVPANIGHFVADFAALSRSAPRRWRARIEDATQRLAGAARYLSIRVAPLGELIAASTRVPARDERSDAIVARLADPSLMIEDDGQVRLTADGTYLITGGLGGLGLEVARWLARKGARHVVLVGRSEPSPRAQEVLAELGAASIRVVPVRCDVSLDAEIARLLAWIRVEMPPLRGIVHAAGVLDDGVLMRLDAERFARVMAPKVAGAWNLHTRTRQLPLDFFVLFSSTVSVLGSPGQANYAAANAFLDGLAHLRRAEGLPATSIDWGTWRGAGLAAAHENRGERVARKGVFGFSPDEGIAALARVVDFPSAQVIVARFALRGRSELSALPLFARLASELGASGLPAGSVRNEIAALAPSERRYRLETYVRKEIAGLLRLPLGAVDIGTSLSSFGFDSLMALELRNRLDTRLGVRLSPTVLWARRSVEELVPYLAELMQLPLDAPAAAVEREAPPTASDLLQDDEIEAALLAKLALLEGAAEDHA